MSSGRQFLKSTMFIDTSFSNILLDIFISNNVLL